MNYIKTTLAFAALAFLTACGGGGSSDENNSAVAADNPLKKYEGTYYSCEGNDKTTITATPMGSDGLNVLFSNDLYQGSNCSGSIIASYKFNSPLSAKYAGKTTATMPRVTSFPYSDTVDKVTLSTKGLTAQLTGSAVKGACVEHSYVDENTTVNSNECFELSIPAMDVQAALYLSSDNQYLLQFSLDNGVLELDSFSSRNPSFNINMLKFN